MLAILFSLFAAILCYATGRRAAWAGLVSVFGVGYMYGMFRANVLSPASHLSFDAAVVGLYAGLFRKRFAPQVKRRAGDLKPWLAVLMIWPVVLCALPFQPILISVVGLRGNAFLLPAMFIGAWLSDEDLGLFAIGLSLLNLAALGFGTLEYFVGVERFFPPSPVTMIILSSRDVAGYTQFRIPSTFSSAHAYAGTMVTTLPLLFGAWSQKTLGPWHRRVTLAGIAAALLGVLLASTRSHFLIAGIIVVGAILQPALSLRKRLGWGALIVLVMAVSLSNERFQRFKSLADTEAVADRVAGSVNHTFLEILFDYPLGNGLGSGGTSIPYFLQSQLRQPVSMENEYARILLEQGLVGLSIWACFIVWFITRGFALEAGDPWYGGRRLAWICCVLYFATGMLGIGLLTSIPQSFLFLLYIGWVAGRQPRRSAASAARDWETPAMVRRQRYA